MNRVHLRLCRAFIYCLGVYACGKTNDDPPGSGAQGGRGAATNSGGDSPAGGKGIAGSDNNGGHAGTSITGESGSGGAGAAAGARSAGGGTGAAAGDQEASDADAGSAGAGVSQCVAQPAGMVAWWPGDGNARDIVGNHDGTLVGGAAFEPGSVAEAFSIDGETGLVDLGSDSLVNGGTGAFTVEFWMFPTRSTPGTYYMPIRIRHETQFLLAFTSDFHVSGQMIAPEFRGQPNQWWIPFTHSSILNKWTHVAATYDGGNKATASSFSILIDGEKLPTGTIDAGSVGGDCNDNAIGGDSGPACGGVFAGFRGLIDEVSLYNRVLGDNEVKSIYDGGSLGKCK